MAIITDATGRQLAQAVGGIDTTGLVKDSTLQATNTELSNIDTTGQSIASAITALGSTLGSDKANIDGSNIVDPSAFRRAIGLSKVIITTNGDFVNLVKNGEAWIVVGSKLGVSQSCIVIATMNSNKINVTEVFKSSSFSIVYNNQGTIGMKYNSSGVGVIGGAIKLN